MNYTGAEQAVIRAMHERGEATRPQLAQATGLSLVSVGKAVSELCRRCELQELAEIPSGGGRPVKLYRYNVNHAAHVLIFGQKEGGLLRCTLLLLDLHGRERRQVSGTFAYLEVESLDGLLTELLRRQRLRSITLQLPREHTPTGMREHLAERWKAAVHTPSTAAILAQGEEEGTATISLQTGCHPSCVIQHGGICCECGPLHLLPMPTDWLTLDYSDRALVEEMVARLLLFITCTLAPERIHLHTPSLSLRLTERIRFNAATKLRGTLPPMKISHPSPADYQERTVQFCAAITQTTD